MIMKATEHDMYRLLDYKEKCLIRAGSCFGISGLLGFFLLFNHCFWESICVFLILASWGFYLVKEALKANGRIMQTKGCYMKLEEDCLVIRQPYKNEHYEVCRIFYREMEKIVEGSRRGIPEFYIVIRKMKETEQTSFILLDKKERETLVFQVRSFGYDKEAFRKFYLKLRWLVPGKVRIIGTKKQTVWKQKAKKHWVGPAFAGFLFYLIPKAVLFLLL